MKLYIKKLDNQNENYKYKNFNYINLLFYMIMAENFYQNLFKFHFLRPKETCLPSFMNHLTIYPNF